MEKMITLEVHQLPRDEVYLDIARVAEKYRVDPSGKLVEEGSVCLLQHAGRKIFVVVRGSTSTEKYVFLDERSRTKLGVELNHTYDFELNKVGFVGKVRWAHQASDVRSSFPTHISFVSVALGILSVMLGFLSLMFARR
jgi:hypothetical protein